MRKEESRTTPRLSTSFIPKATPKSMTILSDTDEETEVQRGLVAPHPTGRGRASI